MAELRKYERVRVVRLLHHPEHYDGWRFNQRPPAVGDIGHLIDIFSAPGAPDDYVVEACGPDGVTIWLGDFLAEELEPVDSESG
jgi:hypothetical protein